MIPSTIPSFTYPTTDGTTLLTVISLDPGGPARTQDLLVPRSRLTRRTAALAAGGRAEVEPGAAMGVLAESEGSFSTVAVDIVLLFNRLHYRDANQREPARSWASMASIKSAIPRGSPDLSGFGFLCRAFSGSLEPACAKGLRRSASIGISTSANAMASATRSSASALSVFSSASASASDSDSLRASTTAAASSLSSISRASASLPSDLRKHMRRWTLPTLIQDGSNRRRLSANALNGEALDSRLDRRFAGFSAARDQVHVYCLHLRPGPRVLP